MTAVTTTVLVRDRTDVMVTGGPSTVVIATGSIGRPGPAGEISQAELDDAIEALDGRYLGQGVTNIDVDLEHDGDLVAAVAAATTAGAAVLWLSARLYTIAALLTIPEGVSIRGAGGTFHTTLAATIIRCTHAAAGLKFEGGGGESTGFLVDGNDVATLPLWIAGASSERAFRGVHVVDSAEDNWKLTEVQNMVFDQCGSQGAARDNLVLDLSTGGHLFNKFESNEPGRHALRISQSSAAAPGAYTEPTHITFVASIFERVAGAANRAVLVEEADNIAFQRCVLHKASGAGPLVELESGATQIIFDSDIFNVGAGVTTGILAPSGASAVLLGHHNWSGLTQAIDGNGIFVDFASHTVGAGVDFVGAGVTNPDGTILGSRRSYVGFQMEAATRAILFSAINGEAGERWRVRADGRLLWNDGTDFSADTDLYRDSAGVLRTSGHMKVDGNLTAGGYFASVVPSGTAAQVAATIQAALDAAETAGGGRVILPPGSFTSDPLTVGLNVTLEGQGMDATTLNYVTNTGDFITLEGRSASLKQLSVRHTGTPSAGALVVHDSGDFHTVDECIIAGGYDNIRNDDAFAWTMARSYIVSPVRYGLLQESTATPDRGDNAIDTCVFDTAVASDAAIRVHSGGGLRVANSKILRHDYGIDVQTEDGATTSVLIVTGSSIEVPEIACFRLGRSGTTGVYDEIVIAGNHLNGGTDAQALILGAGCDEVLLNDNTIKGDAANTAVTVTGAARFTCNGNEWNAWGVGVSLGADAHGAQIGEQNWGDVAIPVELTANIYDHKIVRHHTHPVNVASNSVYQDIYQIDLDNWRGAAIEVVVDGLLQGVGNTQRHITKMLSRGLAAVTVTSISDTAAGAVCDVQFDTATVSGSVLVGVKRNGAPGTQIDGAVSLDVLNGAGVQRIELL